MWDRVAVEQSLVGIKDWSLKKLEGELKKCNFKKLTDQDQKQISVGDAVYVEFQNLKSQDRMTIIRQKKKSKNELFLHNKYGLIMEISGDWNNKNKVVKI